MAETEIYVPGDSLGLYLFIGTIGTFLRDPYEIWEPIEVFKLFVKGAPGKLKNPIKPPI